jgi:DNA repair exonuclease SbcCD ATPase subunit
VASFLRRSADDVAADVEAELEVVRRRSAELETLKQELAARVQAVKERERQLEKELGSSGKQRARPPGDDALRDRLEELERRERSVVAREQALEGAQAPVALPARADEELEAEKLALESRRRTLDEREEHLEQRERKAAEMLAEPESLERRRAEIETRLAELKDAERAFLKTQQELAARSEAVAARERLVAQREREVDGQEDGHGGPGLTELELRLRRLERQQQQDLENTQSFARGLGKLSRDGSRRPPQQPT